MNDMIERYEQARNDLTKRIEELEIRRRDPGLGTMQREALTRRIECMRQERYELLLSINEMRGGDRPCRREA